MTNEKLLAEYPRADPAERQAIVYQLYEQNSGLIKRTLTPYYQFFESEDLWQEAYLATGYAAETFQLDGGANFGTWLIMWIRQTIVKFNAETGHSVRVPANTLSLVGKFRKICRTYELLSNQKPDAKTISRLMGISQEQVERVQKVSQIITAKSLDSVIGGDDEDITLADTLADPCNISEEVLSDLERNELKEVLWDEVNKLPEAQADVIRQAFRDGKPLTEIAKATGRTYGKTVRDKNVALRALRGNPRIKEYAPDDVLYSRTVKHSRLSFWKNNNFTSSTEFEAFRLMGVNLSKNK